jgi:hypothetical protein
LLGALDQIFIQKRFTWYEPFMVGLATEALIQYNNTYPDPRIPYVIKQTLDGMWNAAWRPDLHGFYYRCYATNLVGLPTSLPPGNNGCFDDDSSPGNADSNAWPIPVGDTFDYNDGQPNLNNLISPAYAWMYLQTGDPKYRQEGDKLFADGVLYNGAVNFGGKEFSQNYRWTFDYMNFRNQANSQGASSLSDSQAPKVSVVSPASGTTAGVTMSIIAEASDNVYVTGVQFQADGVNLGPPVTSMPFEQVNLPTYLLSNGAHSVTAIAYDAAGNSAVSAPMTINVSNPFNASVSQCPSTNIPTGTFQGCYYQYTGTDIWTDVYNNNAMTPPPPPTLGTLITTRSDAAINFDWGAGAPATGVSDYQFIVVWQGKQTFDPGMYTFTTSVDGNTGIRVYIDGQMVENQWWPSCGATSSQNNCPQKFTTNFLTSGPRLIRVETFHVLSANNFDSVHVSWTKTTFVAPTAVSATLATSLASVKSGQPVTLTWSSTNAASVGSAIPSSINNSTGCLGTNFPTGTYVNPGGSATVSPTVTTTYSVTCYGPAGSGAAQATVRVLQSR